MDAGISIFTRRSSPPAKCADPSTGNEPTRRERVRAAVFVILAAPLAILIGTSVSWAGDPLAGKAVFETICHGCHAALPYTGRVGDANLPAFLANPRRFNPKTAMTFPGLRRKKDIDDVIAYITAGH